MGEQAKRKGLHAAQTLKNDVRQKDRRCMHKYTSTCMICIVLQIMWVVISSDSIRPVKYLLEA